MGEGPIPTGMAGTAADPGADPETLRQIAFHYPELRPVVAANPAAYQGLLDWLAALGDPKVNAALASRVLDPARPGSGAGRPPTFAPVAAASAATVADLGGTPVQGVPSGGGPRRTGMSTGAKVTLVVLVVAVLVLAGIVWAIFRGAGGGAESGQSSDADSTPTATSTESAQPSESATGDVRYPAPSGAVAASNVVSPSGNIACDLQPDSVTCSIVEQAYAQNGLEDCEGQTFALTADGTASQRSCGTTVPGTGTQLPYGTTAVNGNSACLSDEKGVSCWNTVSGQSFALARQGWQTGNSGEITPDDFRW